MYGNSVKGGVRGSPSDENHLLKEKEKLVGERKKTIGKKK